MDLFTCIVACVVMGGLTQLGTHLLNCIYERSDCCCDEKENKEEQ